MGITDHLWSTLIFFINVAVIIILIFSFEFLDRNLEKLKNLSNITRWIVCWPVLFFTGLVANIGSAIMVKTIIAIFFRDSANVMKYVDALSPFIASFLSVPVLLYLIYRIVPSRQSYVMGLYFLVMLALGSVAFVYGTKTFTERFFYLLAFIPFIVNILLGIKFYMTLKIEEKSKDLSPFDYYKTIVG